MRAYYTAAIPDFLQSSDDSILGTLARNDPMTELSHLQKNAWIEQIQILKDQVGQFTEGWLAYEFSIPRMGRRIDNILIANGIVFLLEFKVGKDKYELSAKEQVLDYALDLKNFHEGSHNLRIVPIVVATTAAEAEDKLTWYQDGIAHPLHCNSENLGKTIAIIIAKLPSQPDLDGEVWLRTGYKPTPTIIEAAQALYQGHSVTEISRSEGGIQNLSRTGAYLSKVIEEAKTKKHKTICFVTGVPGAGKTLAGLNLATQRAKAHEDEHAVFLSGNGPLVDVLREALVRDTKQQGKAKSKSEALREVKSFVQNIHHFRDEYIEPSLTPIERVAVFDEAQRAWDETHVSKFMQDRKGISNFGMSEPEFLISVMDRHKDWCVIVCLVGGGQEINSGEAGLSEWFKALGKSFRHWKVFTSPELKHRDYQWDSDLETYLEGIEVTKASELHLSVSVRSYRAEKVSEFVGALINGEVDKAKALYQSFKDQYPIAVTRDLNAARNWLRDKARGSERYGFVASSGAYRLKPDGLSVKEKIDAPIWFLNGKDDVRSSYYLEDVATQFDVQGLELDWAGICWDADFRYADGWSYHNFKGTRWQNANNVRKQKYLANAYRVLLTRARQGMIVYIPKRDADSICDPNWYNNVANLWETILGPV